MKIDRFIAAIAFLAAMAVSPVRPTKARRPTACSRPDCRSRVLPGSKIAVIYSDAFLDDKTGIAKFSTL